MQKAMYINLGTVMLASTILVVGGTTLIYDATQIGKIKREEYKSRKNGTAYYGTYDGLLLHYKSKY
jgi:hypothetical protein